MTHRFRALHTAAPLPESCRLAELAGALSVLYTDMGTQTQRITVLVHTGFGRRVARNASNGTGGLAYLMGGGVRGGQVVSDRPGLATPDLELGEDLRSVMAELSTSRLGGSDSDAVFPG